MKKIYILLLLISFGFHAALAQPRVDGAPEKILSPTPNAEVYMNAVWSPDGSQIAFSSEKYKGIWVSDANGLNIKQVTADDGAGFKFTWSADGTSILARSVVIDGSKRYHNVKLYNLTTGEETVVLNKTRALKGLPLFVDGDAAVAMRVGNKVSKVPSNPPLLKNRENTQRRAVLFGGALLAVPTPLKSAGNVVFPEFEGRYVFNAEVSPIGDKVVFQVNGLGLYVSDVDGNNLQQIGFGEQATWMPDGKYVVVTSVKDDGQIITSATLNAVNIETGEYTPLLTQDGVIAVKPNVSSDGKKMVFENISDGAIYKLHLN